MGELALSALLLPLAQMRLGVPWSPRAVATDASPGGHGMAYATIGSDTPAEWGRWACHRGERS
eukprot:11161862-Lingulodinium_polyedra.AAC.1